MKFPVHPIFKLAALFGLGMVFFVGCAHIAKERSSDVQWQEFSEEKIEAALAENKTVLVVATAEWCSACNWMKSTTFADEKIVDALNENFVTFALDVDHAPKSAARFMKRGIPSTYILQKDGKIGQIIVAYRDADDYGAFLHRALHESSPNAAAHAFSSQNAR